MRNTSEGLAGARMSSREHGTEEVVSAGDFRVNYHEMPAPKEPQAERRDWLWERICDAAEIGVRTIVIELPENAPGKRATINGLGGLPQRIRS